jgi:putative SOS response-associated peptidase YedK
VCGRIVAATPVAVLAEQFQVADVRAAEMEARYNVAPTDDVVAVATTAAGRRLGTLSWGLVPSWAEAPGGGRRLVNLRSERLADRPGFRRTLQRRRCVVPADGFYEWRAASDDRPKQPFLIRARDGRALALAGLWDVWRDPAQPDADPLRTCTVLTTDPNEVMRSLHDRMPVILAPDACDVWLDPSVTDVDVLVSLCRPCPPELLEAWPVSTAVNSVRNDGPHLVEPVPV